MITAGKGARRKVKDYQLSRYACYLIIQNADPEKEIVARGQTYFWMTRRGPKNLRRDDRYMSSPTTYSIAPRASTS